MVVNKCAQEMLLDLVIRYGCKVELCPAPEVIGNAIEIRISHRDNRSATIIDLTETNYTRVSTEEIACHNIERAATELFRYPYREMIKRHFEKE